MPRCYFLGLCSGSSLYQGTNNVSLFNLVEQINLAPDAQPPKNGLIPVEMHAYFHLAPEERDGEFQLRFVLVALESGLEVPSDPVKHRITTPRFRTRAMGLPFPGAVGSYELRIEVRREGLSWRRDEMSWPLTVAEATARAETVH